MSNELKSILKKLSDLSYGSVIWLPTQEEINEAAAQLMSLINRSEELEKRELGVKVLKHGISPHIIYTCGHCGQIVACGYLSETLKIQAEKYCSHCGYHLDYTIEKKEPVCNYCASIDWLVDTKGKYCATCGCYKNIKIVAGPVE